MNKILITCAIVAQALIAGQNYGTVNGQAITKEDVRLIIGKPIDLNMLPKKDKDKILDQIVKKKLLTGLAMKSGVTNKPEFRQAMDVLKANLALEYWMQKELSVISVSNADMKSFYNKNRKSFTQKPVIKASHILLKTKAKAQELIATIDKSSNKFEKFKTLAKTHSTGPSGKSGGTLGWFEPKDMVPAFSKAAGKLAKGTYTKSPIKTQFGFHIIYLEDKKSKGTASFEDSKGKIAEVLKQKKLMDKIDQKVAKLQKSANIKLK